MEDCVILAVDDNVETNSEIPAVPKNMAAASTATDNCEIVVLQATSDDSVTTTAASCTATSTDPVPTKKKKKKNLIQVSNTKKPFIFYLNLAKKHIRQYNGVELHGLGMAIPTVITISEILKSKGLAVQENVKTSTYASKDTDKGCLIQKAKIEIVLGKPEKFIKTTVAGTPKKTTDATA